MGPILSENSLYKFLYGNLDKLLPESLDWVAYFLTGFAIVFLLANALLLLASAFVYMLRRLIGLFQARLGPNRVGPFGLLQPFADIIKLILKEDIRPREADKFTFNIAPVMMVAPVFILLSVVPFGNKTFLTNINVGVLFIIAVTTISTLAVFLAGWGSGNRYALIGAVRAVAQLVSYEVPMVLSLVGVILLAGSMSLVGIVEGQRIPFVIVQPLGFFVFLMAASAEMNWSPFDLLEAESELTAGFHTEFSGMKFGLLQLAEMASAVVFSGIIATIFLKGWLNPFLPADAIQLLPSQIWFLLKLFFVVFILMWIRATIPRFRIDQVMAFAWKVLFPLAIINIVVTAPMVMLWPEPTTGQIWTMSGINWAVAIGAVMTLSRLLEKNRTTPTNSVRLVRVTEEGS